MVTVMNKTEIRNVLNKFEDYCDKNNLRCTPSRKITLEIIAASNRPIGAYDIIDEMGKVTDRPKPTTVYRAIEFLQQHCFVHKIESLNAFVACEAGHTHDGAQFIVCNGCGSVEEVHTCHLPESLQQKIDASGFRMDRWNTEIHGVCEQCQV